MSPPVVRSMSALALELRQRGLAMRVQLCPIPLSFSLEPDPRVEPDWVVWLFSPLEPLILHCTKHRTLATAIELAIAEYDDEQGEDNDDGSEGSEVAQ